MGQEFAGHRSRESELRLSFVEQAPLFRGLSSAECGELADRARERRMRRAQVLFREGEPAEEVWVLGTGRLKVTQLSLEGQEVILRLIGPGELVGGFGPPGAAASSGTARALESSHAIGWERRVFDELVARSAVLHRNSLRVLGERLRALEDRYRELATEKVPQRLAHALLRLLGQIGRPAEGGVLISLSREELAQMTGTTLFTVSRLLSQWESRGVLRARREAVLVDDSRGLITICEEQSRQCPLTAQAFPGDLPAGCPLGKQL